MLHTHQSIYAFLHNRDVAENGGVFVTRARGLVSVAPKGKANGLDLSKLNPAINKIQGGMAGSGNKSQGRSRLIGLPVFVVQGQYKGYQGTIKDATDDTARVELHTQNKVISLEHSKLRKKTYVNFFCPSIVLNCFAQSPGAIGSIARVFANGQRDERRNGPSSSPFTARNT